MGTHIDWLGNTIVDDPWSVPSVTPAASTTLPGPGTRTSSTPGGLNLPQPDFNFQLPQITPPPTTQQTLSSDISAGPQLTQLADMINAINRNAQNAANMNRIPGEAGLEAQQSQNINAFGQGMLPDSVLQAAAVANREQQAAESGVASGSPGSRNQNLALQKLLGTDAANLIGESSQLLSAATARNPGAPIFDPSTFLTTPNQAASQSLQYQQLQQQAASDAARLRLQAQQLQQQGQIEQARLAQEAALEQERLAQQLQIAQIQANASRTHGYSAPQNPFGGGGRGGASSSRLTPQDLELLFGNSNGTGGASGGYGFSADTLYPGTEMPGYMNLSSLLGPENPFYSAIDELQNSGYGTPVDFSQF